MSSVEGIGQTEEEALNDALAKLGVSKDQAEYRVVSKAGKKLFGLLGNPSVTVVAKKKEVAESAGFPSPGGGEEAGDGEVRIQAAASTLKELIGKMGVDCQVEIQKEGEDSATFVITSDEGGILIGRRGECLNGLEYIINRMANNGTEERLFLSIDTENYRERRKKKLEEQALSAAEEVRSTGRPYKIPNLNAMERKIIHMALEKEGGVQTVSRGEGFDRNIVITRKSEN